MDLREVATEVLIRMLIYGKKYIGKEELTCLGSSIHTLTALTDLDTVV